ncbi:hypothetical protein N8Q98_11010 [Enterobacter hormaechei subsp. hoffmannii]|uniref:hypothetical protein n=1 Tax=Enterobacter hormaechei TaxID=158836 RepID=UPI000797B889|nr:hypothetical protein [Enterobacter hormaechei]MCU2632712.1 hypothetical protein [Enterobacter hormaechei subsp. hoffmannii]MCU2747402.1 hypothetical protein [Enterobacter hormaechei subsp. hoffmannii]MCU4114309.1 hypothetical protein [Enterobacter hormaechei subsp. hoffmannii]MCU4134273.1 hypothetical protein [Enterobacter hormaechei subsp. hoffmannii]SAI21836.1 Uncharacterised protein [Enterobacter hormaechei]
MESITKQLVNIGHGMSREIAADEPAVAKLLVELSSALDVQYERGNALEARCAALAAENANARNAVLTFCDVVGANTDAICEEVGLDGVRAILAAMNATGNMPATDAFLAEVRAQGVEMLHAVFNQAGCVGSPELHSAMNTFMLNIASKIRNGEFAVECKGLQS